MPHPDAIADCVLQAFRALSPKFKPRKLADGRREWVPLAGIVLRKASTTSNGTNIVTEGHLNGEHVTCAALATGMKCLPQSKVPLARGNVLHDSHAEILAIRAFNRFLVDECADLARRGFGSTSPWVRWREGAHHFNNHETAATGSNHGSAEVKQPFELQRDVQIHMYCSECPCGDASMENIMAAQDDSTPWTESQPPATDLLGRGHFDQLGVVRRKPARADAPVTLSKSCSDKLALKQLTSLLSSVTSKLIWPGNIYLSSVVLPEAQIVPAAVERAWSASGRLKPIADVDHNISKTWSRAGYSFQPFSVQATSRTFDYSKSVPGSTSAGQSDTVPSNLSAVYTPYTREILINGVLQGRRQLDPSGASSISRKRMWSSVIDVARSAQDTQQSTQKDLLGLVDDMENCTYGEMKAKCTMREEVKRTVQEIALKNWTKNMGDEYFRLHDSRE